MSKGSPGNNRGVKAAFFVIFFLGLLVLGLYLAKLKEVSVRGTVYADREDALEMVLPEENRRLSSALYAMALGPKKNGIFDSIRIRPSGLLSMAVTVSETPSDCAVRCAEGYAVLNRNAVSVAFYPECPEELTVLTGIDIAVHERYERVSAADEQLLSQGLEFARSVRESGIPCEMIILDPEDLKFVTGNLSVRFGTMSDTAQKLTAFLDMYPNLVGLKGTLHMENYNAEEDTGKFYFEVDQ